MIYPPFQLEEYLAQWEFSAPCTLCSSDLETLPMEELLRGADMECRSLWEKLSLGYTEPRGMPLLREEIAKDYGLESDAILCFAGAEEGIYCMAKALLAPEDHAIVVTPCYQSLHSLPAAHCETTSVPLEFSSKWQLDINAVEAAIRPNSKLLLINFPHNPTGAMISREQQQELIELARSRGLWIFSDEVYHLLELERKPPLPPIASLYEKGISLGANNCLNKSIQICHNLTK